MLSKEGPTNGQLPDSWRIAFNPLFELNEREMADVRARVAAVDGRYIQLGVLSPKEVADARYGGSEWSMELTLDPSVVRELPAQKMGGSTQSGSGFAVPPGGRDPLDQQNGTLPMDGSRDVQDSQAIAHGDTEFVDKDLHQQAVAAAKAKFKTWPSAVAGAYVTQKYKDLYKRKHGSMEGAFKGKKQTAEYFKKDAEPLKTSGFILSNIDEASLIDEQDISDALNQWKQEAPERFKDILEAEDDQPQ